MSVILFLASFAAFGYGFLVTKNAEYITQQTYAALWYIIGAILFTGGAIVDRLGSIRRELRRAATAKASARTTFANPTAASAAPASDAFEQIR